MTQSRRCIRCNILGKIYGHGMCKKCYTKVWHEKNKERIRTNIGKCSGCAQEKKIVYVNLGLCSYCYDNRKFGGRENYTKYRQAYTREYRKTPRYAEYKIEHKEHQALYNAKWRKENPEKHRRAKRRWNYMHQEQNKIGNRRRSHRWYFFRAGKGVGPFDPNEILNKRLLKGVEEVKEGNLKPLKRDNAYE